jgi:hypothetical protein
MTGNPVYPFLLGGEGWGGFSAAAYRADMTGPTSFNLQYGSPAGALAAPWLFFMHDRGSGSALGPFVLTLFPLVLLVRGFLREKAARLSVFAGAYWAAWALSVRDPRFCLPAWPAACAVAGGALAAASGPAGAILRGASLLAALFAPPFAASVSFRQLNPGPCFWGAVSREDYEARLIPPPSSYVPAARAAGAVLGKAGRVLVVGDVKGALLAPLPVYSSMFDLSHLEKWVDESGTPGRLAVKFRQAGISGVLYNPEGAGFLRRQFGHFSFTPARRKVLSSFWSAGLEKAWSGSVYTVFRVGGLRRGTRPSALVPGEP